ncbi:putative quinol monooxygenase [Roseateles sp. SL47]|jgi:quinol monooxygenase YgiN|uniref:putative quinol monooxygenase n=1 Tax=Roseateles sp. SL47 TaxID=2995138 RepID=UPI0022707B32|nr:putative quinol monooxygenase [Roseateles sp. SL47]WAC72277.1 putative quinol monooxygenase [Roseateles sp. SL47]
MSDTSAAPYLQVIAYYHAKPGHGDQVSELLGQLTAATRQEPANLSYDYYRSPQDPDRFVILEQYTDAAGLDAHRASEHFQRLGFGTIIPLLVSRTVSSALVSPTQPGQPAWAVAS